MRVTATFLIVLATFSQGGASSCSDQLAEYRDGNITSIDPSCMVNADSDCDSVLSSIVADIVCDLTFVSDYSQSHFNCTQVDWVEVDEVGEVTFLASELVGNNFVTKDVDYEHFYLNDNKITWAIGADCQGYVYLGIVKAVEGAIELIAFQSMGDTFTGVDGTGYIGGATKSSFGDSDCSAQYRDNYYVKGTCTLREDDNTRDTPQESTQPPTSSSTMLGTTLPCSLAPLFALKLFAF